MDYHFRQILLPPFVANPIADLGQIVKLGFAQGWVKETVAFS